MSSSVPASCCSESVACADVFQLLGHFRWGPVQLFGHILLFVRLHGVELLTQVSIDHILEGKEESIESTQHRH